MPLICSLVSARIPCDRSSLSYSPNEDAEMSYTSRGEACFEENSASFSPCTLKTKYSGSVSLLTSAAVIVVSGLSELNMTAPMIITAVAAAAHRHAIDAFSSEITITAFTKFTILVFLPKDRTIFTIICMNNVFIFFSDYVIMNIYVSTKLHLI